MNIGLVSHDPASSQDLEPSFLYQLLQVVPLNLKINKFNFACTSTVVCFDQRMHACSCICMVENNEKHSKIMKKIPFSSCTWEAHVVKLRKKFVGQRMGVTPKSWFTPKSWLLIWNFVVFDCFSTWPSHVHKQKCYAVRVRGRSIQPRSEYQSEYWIAFGQILNNIR